MSKLTLSVDDEVVQRAKEWAVRQGTSVSRLVEDFLREAAATGEESDGVPPPVLRRLRGCLKGVDVAAHRRHIEAKYR